MGEPIFDRFGNEIGNLTDGSTNGAGAGGCLVLAALASIATIPYFFYKVAIKPFTYDSPAGHKTVALFVLVAVLSVVILSIIFQH